MKFNALYASTIGLALVSGTVVIACSSADDSGDTLQGKVSQNKPASGGDAGSSSGSSGAASSSGSSGSSGVSSSGSSGAASSSGAPTGVAAECAAKKDACFDCCDAKFPNSDTAAQKAYNDCACTTPGPCKTQCAATLCAGKDPDAACLTCLDSDPAAVCDKAYDDACDKDANCKAANTCYDACPDTSPPDPPDAH
jgi:hypothetical protein